MDRQAVIAAAHASLSDRYDFTPEQFERLVADWDAQPVVVDGALVGAVLTRGNEVHACIQPAGFGRWMSKRFVRLVDDLAARYGCAKTWVAEGNPVGVAFVQRLGFRHVASHGPLMVFERGAHGHR